MSHASTHARIPGVAAPWTAGFSRVLFARWCSYIMAARVSVMMRGMANAFGLRLRTAPLWLPVAEDLLRSQGIDPAECTPHANARRAAETAAQ